jgi:hypothetical protein
MENQTFCLLKKRLVELGYTVNCFETANDASIYLNSTLNNQTIGFAGSMSLEKMGLYELLSSHNQVFWHHRIPQGKTSKEVRTQANSASIYITSANAIAESGEIINIDANCNRVASIFYGHDKVYFVIGKNKIEKDYDSALYRARNVSAPLNAKRLGVNTPCAVKADRCYNCSSPERICRGLSVLWAKPMTGEFEILLINEDLGF